MTCNWNAQGSVHFLLLRFLPYRVIGLQHEAKEKRMVSINRTRVVVLGLQHEETEKRTVNGTRAQGERVLVRGILTVH